MFDLGWSELLVIGIVALIVVGPKDLPVMFRRLGEFTGKARRMAREFQSAMNDAARESGVDDLSRDFRKISNPKRYGMDALKDATKDLTSWHPEDATSGPVGDKRDGTVGEGGAPERKPGPHTAALGVERAEAKRKIAATTADAAQTRRAAERPVPDPAAPPPEPAPDAMPDRASAEKA